MSVNLSPIGGAAWQFSDNNGNPLSGGKLYTYAAGTTTPLATYTTDVGDVAHTNPIILDSAGRVPGGQIWLTDGSVDYKFLLETSFSTLVGTFDNIPATLSGSAANIVYLPAGTGAVATTVQAKLRESVSLKDSGAVGDGVANDLSAIQTFLNANSFKFYLVAHNYNLGGGTLTLPEGASILLMDGLFTNGTIVCNGNYFFGAAGLSETISLSGVISNASGVEFDWFEHEKMPFATYSTFINGNNATYGAIPAIGTKNRIILKMLLLANFTVKFGGGIYPFDAEIALAGGYNFRIAGVDQTSTLLWAPNSSFLSYTLGGATNPYIRDIRIEVNGSVLLTQANTVNAIHGLVMQAAFFISYASHTFWNDYTIAGGTGCPIYGSKILDCGVYAGPSKGCFYGWGSGSNVFDNLVDLHYFYNSFNTNSKGITEALFFNSNVRSLINSNIAYSGLKYVYYLDRPGTLGYFYARNNVFENNANSFQAIVKCDAPTSNLFLKTEANTYIGTPKESGYHYLLKLGNTYMLGTDSPTPLYGDSVRNYSSEFVRVVTTKTDSSGTKYRLSYMEPNTVNLDTGANGVSYLITPNADTARLMGMQALYLSDTANISWFQIVRSTRMLSANMMGPLGTGTTAARPKNNGTTVTLYPNYMFFDNTLVKPIWWIGVILATVVSAGSFVVGKEYQIKVIGTTDFTLIGAASNTIGVVFTATGVGTGTGTAYGYGWVDSTGAWV